MDIANFLISPNTQLTTSETKFFHSIKLYELNDGRIVLLPSVWCEGKDCCLGLRRKIARGARLPINAASIAFIVQLKLNIPLSYLIVTTTIHISDDCRVDIDQSALQCIL